MNLNLDECTINSNPMVVPKTDEYPLIIEWNTLTQINDFQFSLSFGYNMNHILYDVTKNEGEENRRPKERQREKK